MKVWHGILVCGVLIALFVMLLMPYAVSPELFSLENSSVSAYHANPAILEEISRESSAELLPLMQEQLDGTETIVLNIRFRNFDEALREFEEYSEYVDSIDRIVVNLDMTESEIGEFRKEARKNLDSLGALINDTESFDSIQELIVQYQEEDDPNSLTQVIFEGEVLRRKIQENYLAYENRSESHASKAEEFELNSTTFMESVDQFRLLAEEIDAIQAERSEAAPPVTVPESYEFEIFITPGIARYGDRVAVNGWLSGPDPAGRIISVYLDNEKIAGTSTGEDGNFSYSFILRTLPEGVHLVYTTLETWHSPLVAFNVENSPTNLSLAADIGPEGEVLVNGTLISGITPVIGAPVRIYSDDTLVATVYTGSGGTFHGTLEMTSGRHQVQAVFSAPSEFPLNDSVSDAVLVVVPGTAGILMPALVVGGCVFGSFFGAFYYLRRQHRYVSPVMTPGTAGAVRGELFDHPVPVTGGALTYAMEEHYRQLVSAGMYREAAMMLYEELKKYIAKLLGRPPGRSATPREVVLLLTGLSLDCPVRLFVEHYEPVRYGGTPPSPARCEELLEYWKRCLEASDRGEGQ